MQATDRLPERERLGWSHFYYHRGLTFREIGNVLGVSEPRAHHLHTQAMTRLRMHMIHQGISQPCLISIERAVPLCPEKCSCSGFLR